MLQRPNAAGNGFLLRRRENSVGIMREDNCLHVMRNAMRNLADWPEMGCECLFPYKNAAPDGGKPGCALLLLYLDVSYTSFKHFIVTF
jgi:hypothetical protein